MDNTLNNVTIEQFKSYFTRDFFFLPVYEADKSYKLGAVVYDDENEIFYKSKISKNKETLDNTDAWEEIEDDTLNYITDDDIRKAMTQARVNGKAFGETCNEAVNIYLHLVAYYLVVDLKNSSQGVNSTYLGMVNSKSVGSVSESYAIPQWLQNNPLYSMYGQNGYGLKYLSLIAPYLACTIMFSRGGSTCG